MARSKKTDADYIGSAKELAKFAPALKKYKRRKKLNPHEKAAIARKVNYFQRNLKSTENLIPLTAAQAKAIPDKKAIAGGGFRAVKLRNTAPGSTISVTKRGMRVKSNGRTFNYVAVAEKDVASFIDAADEILANNRRPTIFLWFHQGRASGGSRVPREIHETIANFFAQYRHSGEFLLGLVYLA